MSMVKKTKGPRRRKMVKLVEETRAGGRNESAEAPKQYMRLVRMVRLVKCVCFEWYENGVLRSVVRAPIAQW